MIKKPTELQFNLMTKIVEDDFTSFNGNAKALIESSEPISSATWTSMIVESASDKGTLASLINADLVWHEGEGRDSLVGITNAGFLVMKQFYGV